MVHEGHAPDAATSATSTVTSARLGRRLVESVLRPAFDRQSQAVERAVLATSELVTNALVAAGECELRVAFSSSTGTLRVEVADASPGQPRMQPPDILRIGGHGLRIVDSVTDRWGVNRDDVGKTVWFELDVATDHRAGE